MASANKMFPLKYSCEEVYERMEKGLCIFCDELDIPGHHNLKHKGVQILLMEYDDDQVSEDKEEAYQETVKNPEPSKETMKNIEPETMKKYDPFIEPLKDDSVLQVVGSVSDVLLVHKVDSHVKEVEELPQKSTSGTGENIAHQLFDQKPVRVTNKEKHTKHLKGWKFKFKGKNLSRVMPQIGQYKFMERKRKRYNKFSSNSQIKPMRTRFSWEHWRAGKRQRISSFQLRYDTRSYIDVFLPIWLRYETQEKQQIGLSRAERVWKPGELVFLQKQWDWRSKVHNCGIIVNIARRLYGSKYEGLVCVLERKKLRNIEDDINHLKRLLATMEGLAQKISCGLLCGDGKFHLKHKWKSRLTQALSGLQFGVDNIVLITSPVKVANSVLGLEVFVENVVFFTGPDKLLFSNNHKLLHPETGFCTQYNDLELLNTEHQSSPAGHINSRIVSVGGVHGLEAQRKRLLVLNEIPLLNNDNKGDLTIEEKWFYNKPMIRRVFHLQRPPELIDLHRNLHFITKVLVQWKEHPPDQFFSVFYGQVLMLSSLRTRMF